MNRPELDHFLADLDADGEQRRFERVVFAVMHRVATTGERVDLAASAVIAHHPIDVWDSVLMPDLIICASDCLRSSHGQLSDAMLDGAAILAAFDQWSRTAEARGMGDRRTRIQQCIGNIRRSLALADAI